MKNIGIKLLVTILVLLIIVFGALLAVKFLKENKNEEKSIEVSNNVENVEPTVVEIKKLQIVDEDSKTRPFGVMINNNHAAWPQCGIKDAYLVYEIIAEGGITRMFALYKDQDTAKIGSIRSARHYFIDYAEENDAIFVHWGGSPQAYSRIRNSGINAIDGMALDGSVFFRDRTLKRDYEHTGFTSMKNLKEYADKKGFTRDTKKDLLLNYSVDEITLDEKEDAQSAQSIKIVYSYYHNTSYEYDEENKVYKRSMSGKPNVDLVTGEQYTAKNIIVYALSNYTINDGENKGRQELSNIGSGTGYYITEGYAVPITWEKSSHSSQTIYKYKNGEEITVNDGNTFIQIYPKSGGSLTITPKPQESKENLPETNTTVNQ